MISGRVRSRLLKVGRGLVLIELLADEWRGVAPRGEGKSIWFDLYEPSAGASEDVSEGAA
ncbi:Magnesium or manganese-dependent protein phosphatase OS=Streptomyces aurantiogriseus OX=66870 GN=GCM10010251_03430 PE=4 SV=1 [Streptomyces aurantiogriseus]